MKVTLKEALGPDVCPSLLCLLKCTNTLVSHFQGRALMCNRHVKFMGELAVILTHILTASRAA